MQCRDFGVGQRLAVFVGDAAADDGSCLQAEMQIVQLLAGSESENPAIGASALLVGIEESAAFGEQVITAGRDVLDAKGAVGTGERGGVFGLGLIVCGHVHLSLLEEPAGGL